MRPAYGTALNHPNIASNASSVEKRSAVILTADKMSALPTRN